MEQSKADQIVKASIAKHNVPNKTILLFVTAVIAIITLFLLFAESPVSANNPDKVLAQLNISYQDAIIAEEDALKSSLAATEAYYNSSVSRCELEKAIAYYKLSNNYETEREADLKYKTTINCVAF